MSSSASTCHPNESLFWSHFASLSSKSTNIDFSAHHHNTNNNNNKYLPPWLKDQTLPFLNEEGIKQVAAVLCAGVAFRNTINEVAESKRSLKQQLEERHRETVEKIENDVENALRDGNRHEFVVNVKKFRDEIERFRQVISGLETSLSSSSSSSTNGTDEHHQLLISKARDTFNSLCQDLAENWKSKYSRDHSNSDNNTSSEKETTSKSSSSPIHQSPPWQLFYSAESDPFSPPSTEESKVTFDGGRILDRFGRDVWEDRCYALGVTIQSGVSVGVGTERYRSANRKNCTKSGLWQRWSSSAALLTSSATSSWITSSISEEDGKNCDNNNYNKNEIEFQICSSSSSSAHNSTTSSCCTCVIIDPFKNDHFVKCYNQRVMAFIEISEKIDKLTSTVLSSSSSSSSSSSPNQNRNNFNDRLRVATIESFKAYRNFPFLMPRLLVDDDDKNEDHVDTDSSNFALSQLLKSAYLTYGQVERLICKTIDLIAKRILLLMKNGSSSATTSTNNNTENNNKDGETDSTKTDQVSRSSIRCIAGLIEDPFLFFIVDIACVCLGVCFVGLHTSWSKDDIHRALHEIVQPDLIIYDKNNLLVLEESVEDYSPSSVNKGKPPDLLKMKITSEELLSATTATEQDSEDDEKKTSLLETTVNAYLNQGLFHDTLLHDKYHFNIFETNTNTTSATSCDSSFLPSRPFTLMFSSGTSGNLKAVEVPAENWLQTNFKQQRYELDPFSVVSFNAMAHGLDRGLCWTALFSAGRVCFVQQSSSSTTIIHETWMKNQKRKVGQRILRAVKMSVEEDSSLSFLLACEQLLPDFIVATRICSPSLIVASPDLWTSLFTLLNKIMVSTDDEDGDGESCSTFLQKLIALQKQEEKGETTSFNFFEKRLLGLSQSQQHSPQKSTTQPTQNILTIQKIVHTLFGSNFRQGATGAAPVSPQVVEFFQNVFSPSFFIDIDADVPRSLRMKKLLEQQQHKESDERSSNKNNDNDSSVGLFYDVYGATEAPGISTNHTLRGGLDIALMKVSGYELLASSTSSYSSIVCHCFGELLVRGSGVARKYHNDEKSSKEAFLENGWYRTGDVVKLEITIATDAEDDVNHKNDDDERTRLKMKNMIFEQIMLANETCLHIVKKQLLSSKTKLFVVDRVKDLIELYVDHQSVWVPASKVEELMMMTTTTT